MKSGTQERTESSETELEGVRIRFTISLGVAMLDMKMTGEALLTATNKAFYAAKHARRNQVCVHSPGGPIAA